MLRYYITQYFVLQVSCKFPAKWMQFWLTATLNKLVEGHWNCSKRRWIQTFLTSENPVVNQTILKFTQGEVKVSEKLPVQFRLPIAYSFVNTVCICSRYTLLSTAEIHRFSPCARTFNWRTHLQENPHGKSSTSYWAGKGESALKGYWLKVNASHQKAMCT